MSLEIRWDLVIAGMLGYILGRIIYWFFLEDHIKAWTERRKRKSKARKKWDKYFQPQP